MTKFRFATFLMLTMISAAFTMMRCGPVDHDPGQIQSGKARKSPNKERTQTSSAECNEVLALVRPAPLRSTKELEKRFLDAHNKIRTIYKLPALSWDASLAAYAQRWAEYLKANNRCRMQHRSHANVTEGKQYGENLAYNWISTDVPAGTYQNSPEGVVKSWSKECKDYNYDQNSCKSGEQCGHFTQIVWDKTQRVGCGMVVCEGSESFYNQGHYELWVCSYDPPGNYIGQWPY